MVRSFSAWTGALAHRAYFWLFAFVLDPLDLYNNYLRPQNWPEYNVSTAAFFYVLGGLVLWTSFLTYHDLRKKTESISLNPDMPLYRVLRWIARDSVWARQYKAKDEEWVMRVQREFLSKWQLGRFEMMGVDRSGNSGITYVPPALKGTAEMEAHKLVGPEPPTHIWSRQVKSDDGMPATFYDVMLDRRQVLKVWPRRSFLGRLLRQSPIERIGDYSEIFRLQDEWYHRRYTIPGMPLEWI